MSKKAKITIALLIAISSFSAFVVLADEAANILYLPLIQQDSGAQPTSTPQPTATVTPEPKVVITGFQPSENPQEDYVTLMNNTGDTLDLTDWYLKAENQSGRYDFPTGFMLDEAATVNVRSGVGGDSDTDLYIGLPFSLWTVPNNCVYVRDQDGNFQDEACIDDAPTPTPEPSASVYISGFHPSSIPQDDYVTISNSTSESFDLTGWWMKAESESGRYDFPADFMLNGGGSVNVRSGVGPDTTTDLFIGGSYSLWTSQNNCAYLRYKDGTLLDKKCVNEDS